jgi:uncharacterized protein (UPF0218 family)
MPLTPEDILILKEPFGTLVKDQDITEQKIKDLLKNAKLIISVGDSTTDRLISFGILPHVSVIDGRERRLRRISFLHSHNTTACELHCCNPAGTVSRDAISILHDAFRTLPPIKIVVDGEEDMLTLPIITIAPEGTIVLYGQPLEGMVVVTVTAKTRKKAKDLMDRIGID